MKFACCIAIIVNCVFGRNSFAHANARLCFVRNHFEHRKTDTSIEDRIVQKVFDLPEVQEKGRFIDSISNHKHGVSIIIVCKPIKKDRYYLVQAGYNNKIRFEPYLTFYVYEKSIAIFFYNTIDGSVLSLAKWRQLKSKPLSK